MKKIIYDRTKREQIMNKIEQNMNKIWINYEQNRTDYEQNMDKLWTKCGGKWILMWVRVRLSENLIKIIDIKW